MSDNGKFQTYLDDIGTQQLLSNDEEQQLAEAIGRGDTKSLVRLVEANLRFVVSMAKGYTRQGLRLEDLVSEGNLGLMKAASKFKPSAGKRFAAFAAPFIRQSIEAAIGQQASLYRIPEAEQTAAERKRSHAVSIDAPIPAGSQNNFSLLNILENSDAPQADRYLEQDNMAQELQRAAAVLNEREQQVVSAFYGIGRERRTLAEIGEEMGLKRERVRQIRNKAVRKLRRHARRQLKELQ